MKRFAVAVVLALYASGLRAATYPVDDSRSQVLSRVVRMKWDAPMSTRRTNTVSGQFSVITRLDVSPWRGRHGRIYLTLPPQSLDTLTVQWTTRGRLLPGEVRMGQRTLVYTGPITSNLLEDTLQLSVTADGSRLARMETVEFRFEIDLDTP